MLSSINLVPMLIVFFDKPTWMQILDRVRNESNHAHELNHWRHQCISKWAHDEVKFFAV